MNLNAFVWITRKPSELLGIDMNSWELLRIHKRVPMNYKELIRTPKNSYDVNTIWLRIAKNYYEVNRFWSELLWCH